MVVKGSGTSIHINVGMMRMKTRTQEATPIIRRKKDSRDGRPITLAKKARKTEAEMATYCVNRDVRAIGTTKDEVHDRTGWRRIVSATATPQPSGSG